ncbi:MAG TPA: DUF2235 domain-containing protein [Marmoricola sp.]|nr:DUF2235 domain-containing protein [Marmoricola sp.]
MTLPSNHTLREHRDMKRLVVCCDGTWNRPDAKNVTNIEKIARTVETDLARTGGVQQLVLYLSGVGGAGYHTDRLLGGAFGLGLFHNVLAGYRFLALHYEPGDEIYVFGFSRGAYTARSLGGMIGKVGLLTRRALVEEKLPEAVERYQGTASEAGEKGSSTAEFKRDFCHPDTPIHFIGVFDTVGALGVPGALRRRHQFHDVKLSDAVRSARQALAADERRMKFEPCLWDAVDESCCEDPRVKQVWFEGAHSDVGGGYPECGLSDSALLWMVSEANEQGLAFDEELLGMYVACGKEAVRHDSSKPLFKVLDLVIRTKIRLGLADGRAFDRRDRRLHRPDCVSVRVAESTADHYRAGEDYRPRNLAAMAHETDDFTGCVEPVIGLPEKDYDTIVGRLAQRGVSLGKSGAHVQRPADSAPLRSLNPPAASRTAT